MRQKSMRTPLGRARGLGSAKKGADHWIAQRVSAVALAILAPWLLLSFAPASVGGRDMLIDWAGAPWNAVGLVLLLTAAFYHMRLGLQVVIEDYLHAPLMRSAALIANTFLAAAGWALGVFAVLKIAFAA